MPGEWYGICQCWTAISTSMLPMFFKASRRRLLHVNVLHLDPRPDTYLFCRYTSLPYTPHAWLPRSFISAFTMSRAVLLAENHWFDVHSMSFAFRGEVNQLQLDVATATAAHVVTFHVTIEGLRTPRSRTILHLGILLPTPLLPMAVTPLQEIFPRPAAVQFGPSTTLQVSPTGTPVLP